MEYSNVKQIGSRHDHIFTITMLRVGTVKKQELRTTRGREIQGTLSRDSTRLMISSHGAADGT